MENGLGDGLLGGGGRRARQHLIQHDTDRVDICSMIRCSPGDESLRCGIVRGAVFVFVDGRCTTQLLCQSEIGNLDLPIMCDQQIGWFDVAVRHTMVMSVLEGVTQLNR